MSDLIAEQVSRVKARIRRLRPEGGVKIMAVTKNRSYEESLAAIRAGVDLVGENRVQEARDKWREKPPVPLHLIGHLQTNKVKYATELFDGIDSVDSERVAEALNARLEAPRPVMLQLNGGREASKTGVHPDLAIRFLAEASRWPHLVFNGIMAVLPLAVDSSAAEEKRIRQFMQEIGEVWRMCREEQFPWAPLAELSMGMSGDYEWAVEAGSTMVRLGTVLFGSRSGI